MAVVRVVISMHMPMMVVVRALVPMLVAVRMGVLMPCMTTMVVRMPVPRLSQHAEGRQKHPQSHAEHECARDDLQPERNLLRRESLGEHQRTDG